eukprot:g4414.t1
MAEPERRRARIMEDEVTSIDDRDLAAKRVPLATQVPIQQAQESAAMAAKSRRVQATFAAEDGSGAATASHALDGAANVDDLPRLLSKIKLSGMGSLMQKFAEQIARLERLALSGEEPTARDRDFVNMMAHLSFDDGSQSPSSEAGAEQSQQPKSKTNSIGASHDDNNADDRASENPQVPASGEFVFQAGDAELGGVAEAPREEGNSPPLENEGEQSDQGAFSFRAGFENDSKTGAGEFVFGDRSQDMAKDENVNVAAETTGEPWNPFRSPKSASPSTIGGSSGKRNASISQRLKQRRKVQRRKKNAVPKLKGTSASPLRGAFTAAATAATSTPAANPATFEFGKSSTAESGSETVADVVMEPEISPAQSGDVSQRQSSVSAEQNESSDAPFIFGSSQKDTASKEKRHVVRRRRQRSPEKRRHGLASQRSPERVNVRIQPNASISPNFPSQSEAPAAPSTGNGNHGPVAPPPPPPPAVQKSASTSENESLRKPPPVAVHSEALDLKRKGNALYTAGNYSDALDLYSKACKLDPDNPVLLGNRAAALLMLERFEEAIQHCVHATEIDPEYLKGYLRAGRAFLTLGNSVASRRQFEGCKMAASRRKASLQPGTKNYANATAALKEASDGIRRVNFLESSISEAESLLRQTQSMKAKLGSRRSHSSEVDRRAILLLATEALNKAEDAATVASHSQNLVALQMAALLGANTIEGRLRVIHRCFLELRNGFKPRAGTTPESTVALYLTCGRALHLAGDLSAAQSTLSEAMKEMRAAGFGDLPGMKEISSELKAVHHMQTRRECGNSEFRNSKYAKAYDAYSGALQFDPSHDNFNALLFCNRAAALMALGLNSEAVDDCDAAMRRRKFYPKAQLRKARALACNGSLQPALNVLNDLISKMSAEESMRAEKCNIYTPSSYMKAFMKRSDKRFGVERDQVLQEKKNIQAKIAGSKARRREADAEARRRRFSQGTSTESNDGYRRSHRSQRRSSNDGRSRRYSQPSYSRGGSYPGRGAGTYDHRNSHPSSTSSDRADRRSAYSILGVRMSDSDAEIKKAYRKLILKVHPDKQRRNSAAGKPATSKLSAAANGEAADPGAQFKVVQEAYEQIKDAESRRKYNRSKGYF